MLKLPNIPYSMEKNKRQVVSMGSINYSKMTNDGDIADSGGISGRHFPLITTARGKDDKISGVAANKSIVAITVFRSKFVEIDELGYVYYGGDQVGSVSPDEGELGDIQFAAINTKLVIMPFKKYLDAEDVRNVRVKSLGASAVFTTETEFESNAVIFKGETAHSFKIFGGSVSESVFFPILRNVGASYTSNRGLAISDGGRSIKPVCSINMSHYWSADQIGAYMTANDRAWIRAYGVYIFDSKMPDNSGWHGVKYIEEGVIDQDGYGLCQITLTKKLTKPNITEYSLDLYRYDPASNYVSEQGEEVNVRLSLTNVEDKSNQESFGKMSVDISYNQQYTALEGEITDGLYEGTIDNGGWSGDFRDYISAGRDVSFGEKTYTVTAVDQSSFTLNTSEVIDVSADSLICLSVQSNLVLTELFSPGDVVSISGCSVEKNNIDFKVDSIDSENCTLYAASDVFEACKEAGITIERRIPTLDYICESDNRLYGCSNEDNTIYVSALGDPTNIYAYQGISTDSYAVAVASEEPFTGCCPYDGGVLFWKENKLHKLLGSYPAEYALYTYNIDGVQKGSHKSLQNIGEVLYYKGVRGVFAFNGSPQLISSNFGDKYFKDAVAGTDGAHYLISMKSEEGGQHFFSFDTGSGLWVREGSDEIKAFTRKGKDVYFLEDGKVCVYGAEETPADAEWFIQFTPIYETIEGQKSYSRIKLRVELPRGSHIILSVRCDGGRWAECGKIVGRVDGVIPVMVPINRCDKFELKIEGKGPCTIHSILREYFVGGDR